MAAHIPPDKLLPQDMVDMHDHGPREPVLHRMHAVDAKHAMDADPDRWTLAGELPEYKKTAGAAAKTKKA